MKRLLLSLLLIGSFLYSANITVRDTNVLDGQNNTLPHNGDGTYSLGAGISEGALDVHVKEIHTNIINQKMHFETTTEQIQHITRILFSMVHTTAGDMGKFGNLPPLTRGVLVRAFYKRTGEYKTVTNWKINQDIANDMYDVRFDSRAGGGGDFGTSGRWTLTSAGIVAELEPGTPIDFIEVLVQDNLTGLTSFTMNVQGHTED